MFYWPNGEQSEDPVSGSTDTNTGVCESGLEPVYPPPPTPHPNPLPTPPPTPPPNKNIDSLEKVQIVAPNLPIFYYHSQA